MKTCRNGHPRTVANTELDRQGRQRCKLCRLDRAKEARDRNRLVTPYAHRVLK
jgi:hypothetical protein